MCFGNNQQTGSSNSQQYRTGVSSTNYDPWATQTGQNIVSGATGWQAAHPWQNYSGPTQAEFGPEFGQASSALTGALGAIDPRASIQSYMDPYVEGVLSPVIDQLNTAYNQASGANARDAAMSGAYGGSAQGVQQALLQKNYGRAVSDATNRAYSQAWNNAQQQRMENMRMYSMLAQLLGGFGTQRQQAGQQGIQTAIGLNSQNQTMPLNQYGMLAQILRGVPLNQTQASMSTGGDTQQNYQPNDSGFNFLGSALGSAALT